MILYHGSNMAFDNIDLSKSKKHKDFNKAFYLSKEKTQEEFLTGLQYKHGETFQYAFCTEKAISKLRKI